jgi:hypothetical protein
VSADDILADDVFRGAVNMDINTSQRFPNVQLSIQDSQGRPAAVDGVPQWASSDETVLRVTPAADGMSAVVDTVAIGVARVTVSADADLGSGTAPITGVSEDVNVVQDPATTASTLVLNLGTPESK